MPRSPIRSIVKHPINLQSYASEGAPPGTLSVESMRRELVPVQDARRTYRERFGRSISMDAIEVALLSASRGSMQQLTDLSRETIDTDPHLASVLAKRFGAVASLPWEVQPAQGYGIDKDRAMFYAAVVREQLKNLGTFRQFVKQLAWAKFDGRSAHEIKWAGIRGPGSSDYGVARWAVTRLEWIHPRRLNFGPARETRIVSETQRYSSGGNFSPVGLSLDPDDMKEYEYWRRFVSWRPQMFGEYPEREGLAPRCMYWSFFKRFSARDRMVLLELFGKPWRILEVPDDSTANREDLTAGDSIIDALGASRSARLPRGTALNVVQPTTTAGAVHQQTIEESDKQISKLVLGQTGTTDGVPAGLNSSQANVMAEEQLMILQGDAAEIAEVIETQVADAIIEVNFGPQALPYSPRFVLRADIPADRVKELERLKKALEAGIEVSLDEAYDISGFRSPEPDEPKIRWDQPPTPFGAPNPPNPRPVIVYPPELLPEPGVQTPPTETAPASTVEPGTPGGEAQAVPEQPTEAQASARVDLRVRKDGDTWIVESEDGSRTFGVFEVKRVGERWEIQTAAGETVGSFASHEDATARAEELAEERLRQVEWFKERETATASLGRITLATPTESKWGDLNDIKAKAVRKLAAVHENWGEALAKAVEGKDTAAGILTATTEATNNFDKGPYEKALSEGMLHGAALGALDNATETGTLVEASKGGDVISLAKFSEMSFEQAMRAFLRRLVINKETWEDVSKNIRRHSFTVAEVQSHQMLRTVHEELTRQIQKGANLREFKKWMTDRLKSEGYIGAVQPATGAFSAPHVETVFRTNVQGAYNSGRVRHAMQPEVLELLPIWEIRTIPDDRRRENHGRAHGQRLRADDPYWQTAYPPFGFNCRCVVVSQPATMEPTPGAWQGGLPDPGFVSGISSIF